VSNEPLVLAALILAHLVADFVLQTDAIALGKFGDGRHAWNMLLAHAGLVTVTCLPLVLVFGLRGLLYVALTAVTHFVIDRAKIVLTMRAPQPVPEAVAEGGDPAAGPPLDRAWSARPAALFVVDQLAHLAVLVVAWYLLLFDAPVTSFWNDVAVWVSRHADPTAFYHLVLGTVVLLDLAIVNVRAAALMIGTLVRAPQPPNDLAPMTSAPEARVGAVIGILERVIVVALVLVGQYAAIGLVVTAKTIARFRQLEDRQFAEYYLLGTLASIATAILTGMVGVAALT
jgi:Protein of unknown function (DUF3307)